MSTANVVVVVVVVVENSQQRKHSYYRVKFFLTTTAAAAESSRKAEGAPPPPRKDVEPANDDNCFLYSSICFCLSRLSRWYIALACLSFVSCLRSSRSRVDADCSPQRARYHHLSVPICSRFCRCLCWQKDFSMKELKKVLGTTSRSLPTLSREVLKSPRSLSPASVFFWRLRSVFSTRWSQLDRTRTATEGVVAQPSSKTRVVFGLTCPLSPLPFATFAFSPPAR